MSILMLLELDGVTVEQYAQVNESMGIRGDEDAPDGLLSHAAAVTDRGLLIADVWDSEESLQRFFDERVGPAMAAAGVPPGAEPQIHEVHNFIPQGSGTDAAVLMIIESDEFTPELYDRMTARMPSHVGDGSAHPAASHIAAKKNGGMVFVDVWDSPETFARFAEDTIGPAAEGEDVPALEPRFHPLHKTLKGSARAYSTH